MSLMVNVPIRSTPPTSPQLAHNAGHQAEHVQHVLGSPPSCYQPNPTPPLIAHAPVPLPPQQPLLPMLPPAPLPPQMMAFSPPYYQNLAPPAPPPQNIPEHVDYIAQLLEGYNNDHERHCQHRRNQRTNNLPIPPSAHPGPSHAPSPPNYHAYQ
ncbi:hypothetical protein EV401DRAFT_2082031 [Pisolithus croceorrhizus]|nr:hypothetical protein EV401DRAFT_2082031 [Pisolithus croceorrhizus]